MTADDDPFEEAARREHDDRLRREARIAAARDGIRQRDDSGMGVAIVVFLGPYLLWAALRAGNHAWTTPTVGKSIISFFFGSGIPFALYTGWMLFLVWAWAITVTSLHPGPRARQRQPGND